MQPTPLNTKFEFCETEEVVNLDSKETATDSRRFYSHKERQTAV